MKQLVIFDLDGTLFDTTLAMQLAGNYALDQLGLPTFPREAYAAFSGAGVEGYITSILEAAGDTEHRFYEDFWHLYQEENSRLPEHANAPFPEVPALLQRLKEKGVRLALLSNKDQASCDEIIEKNFGSGIFDAVRGDRLTLPPKPSPEGVFSILSELGTAKENCLYVGDTQVDLITGKNAGIDTAAALWGYRTKEQLEPYQPEFMVSHPLEILDLI